MDTFSLTGFWGAYEDAVQEMIRRGVAFVAREGSTPRMWEDREHPTRRRMEDAMCEGISPSGAQMGCALGHVKFIAENGRDVWLTELAKHRDPAERFCWEKIGDSPERDPRDVIALDHDGLRLVRRHDPPKHAEADLCIEVDGRPCGFFAWTPRKSWRDRSLSPGTVNADRYVARGYVSNVEVSTSDPALTLRLFTEAMRESFAR